MQQYRGVPPIDETQVYVRNGVRYLRLLRPLRIRSARR